MFMISKFLDIKLVERPEDRTGLVEFLESAYRFFIGSLSGLVGASVVYPVDLGRESHITANTKNSFLSEL